MTPTFKLVCQLVISALVILGFYAFCFVFIFHAKEIDPNVKDALTQISGAMIAAFGGVVGFWLGTSLSSASKDHTISNLTKGPTP